MAIISDPFVATIDKQLSREELIQALRADIIGEYEAVMGYEAHALSSPDARVREILHQIANDEKKHIGQLMELLHLLSPQENQMFEQGKQTAQQKLKEIPEQEVEQ